jgi:ABC-type multidrug transport system fused ATPase/permease subunit
MITEEFQGWTVIVVTHRIRAVADPGLGFDQVVVLDKGRIIEKASPAALLRSGGSGVFREMVMMENS